MKVLRRLLVVAGAAALASGALVAVALHPGVQTWAARRALADRPDLRVTFGSVSAGLGTLDLRELEYRRGAAVLRVPRLRAEVPWWPAVWRREVRVAVLEARGWTLDLSRMEQPVAGAAAAPAKSGAGGPPPAAAEAAKAFAGVFAHLGLPFDLTLDRLDLAGDVILPEGRGRVAVGMTGGGLGAGREAVFTVTANAALTAAEVSRGDLKATLSGKMESPRSFARLGLTLAAEATGTQFPAGAKLAIDASASRATDGENYSAAVVTGPRELMKVAATFPPGGDKIAGSWRLDVRDADLLPFVLGQPLPTFAAAGEGRLESDAALAATRISGRLEATAGNLQVVAPELAGWGNIAVVAQFDVTRRAETFFAERFEATLGGAQPVATVRAMQPFEFRPTMREARPTRDEQALLGVSLHAVPVEWARPWLGAVAVTGGAVRGELRVRARPDGGLAVRTEAPLEVGGVSVAVDGRTWLREAGLKAEFAADFSAAGWQLDLTGLDLRQGEARLASVAAKLGRLAGKDQALKSTGTVVFDLARLAQQPAAGGGWSLSGGEAQIDYAVSWGSTGQVVAKAEFSKLTAKTGETTANLPRVTGDLRMDVGAGGRMEFRLPLTFRQNDRVSDALLAGAIDRPKPGEWRIDATVASERLVVDDVGALGAAAVRDAPTESPGPTARAPWAGLGGAVALTLKEVVWSEILTVRGVTGRLLLDAGTVKLEELRAGLGEHGRLNAKGAVSFDAGAERPFGLAADVSVRELDSGLLFDARAGGRPATIEGRFDVTSTVAGRARRLGELAREAGGEVALKSKGGIFRGLPVSFVPAAGAPGKLAGIVATAGNVIGSFAGRKEPAEIGSRAQAAAELARAWHPIAFDQLSLVVSRDAALNTTLRDFVLIAPELRLAGGGTALHRPGGSLLHDALAMEFKLSARGRQAELLRHLGVLDTQADELGYLPCTVPLRIAGSAARPDAGELNVKLAALALEKTGVTEKASELFNRVFGGGK